MLIDRVYIVVIDKIIFFLELIFGGVVVLNYVNFIWGSGVFFNNGIFFNLIYIWDKVIVDGFDMEEWFCIVSKDIEFFFENIIDNNSVSNFGFEKSILLGSIISNKGKGS